MRSSRQIASSGSARANPATNERAAGLRLWLLAATDRLKRSGGTDFYPSVDCGSLVVLAGCEAEARAMARSECDGDWWLDPTLTTCVAMAPDGSPRVILASCPELS
jgi:hypothetical protein